MAIFHFGSKNVTIPQTTAAAAASVPDAPGSAAQGTLHSPQVGATLDIKVLGGGCAKCNQLEDAVRQALTEIGIEADIDHVRDFGIIASYGVMSTPALMINGKVVSAGKVLRKNEVVKLIGNATQA